MDEIVNTHEQRWTKRRDGRTQLTCHCNLHPFPHRCVGGCAGGWRITLRILPRFMFPELEPRTITEGSATVKEW